MSTLTATQLQQQYIAYFGRPGDPAGIKYWLSSSSGISSAREFADKIYAQDEYKGSTVGSKSISEQVNSLYTNLFGRTADAAGLLYWTAEIESGNLQLSNVAFDLIYAANNPLEANTDQGALDAKTLTNKTAAATAYTAELEGSTEAILAYQPASTTPWKTSAAYTSATNYLSTIDGDTESTASGITDTIATMTAATNAVTSNKITLTNTLNTVTGGVDDVLGGAGSDLIIGSVAATNPTYSLVDTIDGGAGTDTLNISMADNTDAVTVNNVEKIIVRASAAKSFDASGVTGATDITSTNSTADLTLTSAPLASAIGMTTTGTSDLFVGYRTGDVSGATDIATLKLNGVASSAAGDGRFYTDNVETLSITTSGVKSKLGAIASDNDAAPGTIGGASTLTTLNVAGDVELTVTTALNASVKTIDASAMTAGGVNLGITAGKDVTVTGSAGDDEFSFLGASNLAAKDVVDGGDGVDRLIIDENDLAVAQWAKTTNFEAIEAQAAGTTAVVVIDASMSGITTLYADIEDTDENAGAVSATFNKVTDSQVLEVLKAKGDTASIFDAINSSAITVEHATDNTENTFTVNLAGIGNYNAASGGNALGVSTLTVSDAETLTIGSNKNEKETVTKNLIASLVAGDATTINVNGDAELTVSAITAANATLLDASAATNKLNITFDSAKTRTIKLGSNDDTLVVGNTDAKVTVEGGAGDDKITFQGDSITKDDSIDGGEGTDTLILNADFTINSIATAATIVGFKNLEKVSMGDDDDLTINDAFLGAFTDSSVTITREVGSNANLVTASGVLNSGNTVKVDGASQTSTGALNFVGSNGIDIYSGTPNADSVTFTDLTIKSTDTVDGAAGADIFYGNIDGTSSTSIVNIVASQLTGVESFGIVRVADTTNAGETVGIVIDDEFVTSNEASNALSIVGLNTDGSTVSDDLLTFDASAVTTTYVALTLTGGSAVDTLIGGAGADIITGGASADKLTGGAGKDDFMFSNTTTVDNILDLDLGTKTGATTKTVDQINIANLITAGIDQAFTFASGFDSIALASAGSTATTVDVLIMDTATYATELAANSGAAAVYIAEATADLIVVWADTFNTVHFGVKDGRNPLASASINTITDFATTTNYTLSQVADVLDVGDFIIA